MFCMILWDCIKLFWFLPLEFILFWLSLQIRKIFWTWFNSPSYRDNNSCWLQIGCPYWNLMNKYIEISTFGKANPVETLQIYFTGSAAWLQNTPGTWIRHHCFVWSILWLNQSVSIQESRWVIVQGKWCQCCQEDIWMGVQNGSAGRPWQWFKRTRPMFGKAKEYLLLRSYCSPCAKLLAFIPFHLFVCCWSLQ